MWAFLTQYRLAAMTAAAVAALLAALLMSKHTDGAVPAGEPVKTASTFYTAGKITAARDNIAQFAWARSLRDAAVAKADRYAALGYEFLWSVITPQSVPRSYAVNEEAGSPVAGHDIDAYGDYPYQTDPAGNPWKIVDPSSGYQFPTNDYAAYYQSGLNDSGLFDPALADRSLLVNKLYPDKGADWGVDDGSGWIDGDGNKFMFVAYYNHWGVWRDFVEPALTSLRDAYLYTGNDKYAQAGLVMLDRIADVYPAMDVSVFKWEDGYKNSHGLTGQGKILGSIWEGLFIREVIASYDAFFPALRDDAAAVAFLKAKARTLRLDSAKADARQIKLDVENGLLRQIYPAVQKAQIYGNVGFHQSALAMAAVVLDDPAESKKWIDFIFQTGGLKGGGRSGYAVTGGGLAQTLVSEVDRDGYGSEASPEYNSYWLSSIKAVADILEGYKRYKAVDLYGHPKFRKMFGAMIDLIMVGRYTEQIGDSGSVGNPELKIDKQLLVKGFEKYRDPVLAQAAYFANGNKTSGLVNDIFASRPDELEQAIAAVVKERGPLNLASVNLTGYGFAALRDGATVSSRDRSAAGADRQRDLWMYYGRNGTSHAHRDSLGIGLHAFGLDLAPDMGYPSYADNNELLKYWEGNTISHNTVVVNRSQQLGNQWTAQPLHYDDTGVVKLIDVEAPSVYAGVSMYRRTSALIRVDDANSYAVDFFRVQGGSDHHYSFHAAEASAVATEHLSLTKQASGTFAGSAVPYRDQAFNRGSTSGFNYLTQVQRDNAPSSSFSVDWTIKDTRGVLPKTADPVHLRMTMLGPVDDVALASGEPPQNKPGNPAGLPFVIAHRGGTNVSSTFTAVFEPYRGSRFVHSVAAAVVKRDGRQVADLEARAVKVTLANGRVDYVVSALQSDVLYTIDDKVQFQGSFGVYAEMNGKPAYGYVGDGTRIGLLAAPYVTTEAPALTGTVVAFTKELATSNAVTVAFDPAPGGASPESLLTRKPGVYASLIVDNDRQRNAVYAVRGMKAVGEGGAYSFDIGDATLVRAWRNPGDFGAGFVYDIDAGAKFRLPLSAERSALPGGAGGE
ncbi:MAG: heparinase II/III family protein [Paenibacillaceae bacterium]|nr:heparinase II/III family protein [Paenibacillaceae bacterium]